MFELICISNNTKTIAIVDRKNALLFNYHMPFRVSTMACFDQLLVVSDGSYKLFSMDLITQDNRPMLYEYGKLISDTIQKIVAFQNIFLVFGKRCIERWSIVKMEKSASIIQPIESSTIYFGLANKYCALQMCGFLYFLDTEGCVRVIGSELKPLNSPILAEYFKKNTKKDTRFFELQQNGHIFLGVYLDDLNIFVFDITTGIWTQIKKGDAEITTSLLELKEDRKLKFNQFKIESVQPNAKIKIQYSTDLGASWSEDTELKNIKLPNAKKLILKIKSDGNIREAFLDVN